MFQRVVQTFDLRHLIGAAPKATVFQAVLCLLLYNATLIVRDYVAQGAAVKPEDVSLDLLFDAVRRDRTGCMEVIGGEATAASLAAYCQRLQEKFPMSWLFTSAEGVEPTNNHAERVQRRAVLWRRKSFGCASGAGCRFVERILTVVGTLRRQGRNALEFLSGSIAAHRLGAAGPRLCMG